MTIPVPLTVAIKTSGGRYRHIGDEIDDLTFGSTSPGGYAECTVSLHGPISYTPAEVAQFARLYVMDARSGSVVWEGRLQDPGRSAGSDGSTYQLAAVGGQAHLQDDTRQLFLADTELSRWDSVDKETAAAFIEQIGDLNNTGVPVMLLRIPQGTSVDGAIPSRAVAAHRGFAAADQKIARVSYSYDCGLTSANITHSLYAATEGVGAADVAFSTTFNVASGSTAKVIGTDWTSGRNRPIIRFHYTAGAASVSTDTWWLQLSDVNVRSTLYDKAGSEKVTGASYTTDTILAHDVVADVLGRTLGATIDGANATIATTSYAIDQLAYPDGVTPAKLLEDLMLLEQAYTYHIWESNPDNGKFRFEWIAWPNTVRYEADIIDGFSAPASGNTIFNQARVRWHNRGTIHTSLRTLANPVLDAAGLTRTHYIDTGDEASTQANAHRAGDQFLTEHRYPVNAGRLVVAAPIVDYQLGRTVQPWEIRAGNLIRVRGVASSPDSLNNSGRDGNTVFKVAAATYSASDATATLDLDSHAPSVARALATLVRKPTVRRR